MHYEEAYIFVCAGGNWHRSAGATIVMSVAQIKQFISGLVGLLRY